MTRYTFALAMAEACGLSTDHIHADKSPPKGATRPHNSQLSCERLEQIVDCKRTPFKEAIKVCLQPFLE